VQIYDKGGNLLASSNPPESRIFDDMVIRNAFLAGKELEGISFDGSDLRSSDFSGADLYGAILSDCRFDLCILAGADLRSSFLNNVSFCNADLRGARFSRDNMNMGLNIWNVNFAGADLAGADFTGAIYDELTIFPRGFIPEEHGLSPEVKVD